MVHRVPDPAWSTVAVVIGTRPEAVKLRSVVLRLGPRARVLHTGQHFDEHLWRSVTEDLRLPEPAYRIRVGGISRGRQIGAATTALTEHLEEHPAAVIVVQGDTNSTVAGALAGNATGTLVVHVEAGLRCGDLTMPEESNRLLTDRIADLCCAPTQGNADRLLAEGIGPDRVVVTGNTLAETIRDLLPTQDERHRMLDKYRLRSGAFALATLHRASNVDDPDRLARILLALDALGQVAPTLLPLHPRTRARATGAGVLQSLRHVRIVDPLPPTTFLTLEAEAGLLVSDSGGVQEEAALFGVPLVMPRDSTERPELLGTWCRLLGSDEPTSAFAAAWHERDAWRTAIARAGPPYADHGAAARVVEAMDLVLNAGSG